MFKKTIIESTGKSPWLFHINAGSCNGCDIEIVSVLTPRYDAERVGFKLVGSPRHADIAVVSGPVTKQSLPRVLRTLEQIPEINHRQALAIWEYFHLGDGQEDAKA